ncbi:MAG TPA: hypothetical protein VGR08_04085, partial [Thermomicrobiales bacterium]|nr:hypothetical protein [Thermomicrobiales bacterium]
SVVPRGRALGVTVQMPDEDKHNYSRTYLLGRLAGMLGGRAAEMVVYGEITTGAENDLKQATSLARRMVGLWGMSEDVGPIYLGTGEEHVFLGREITQDKSFSDATSERLDAAVRGMVENALQQALALVSANRDKLDALVNALLERETLDAPDVIDIFGPAVPEDPEAGMTQRYKTTASPVIASNGADQERPETASRDTDRVIIRRSPPDQD